MYAKKQLQIELLPYNELAVQNEFDLDKIIYDLDNQLDLLSNKADKFDYLISVASGILCGMLDILWVGDFSLADGREIADNKIGGFVQKTAKMLGCKDDDVKAAVRFLEQQFPIPSDGNTPDFGGGLQHHLRDFAHHPTIVGLMFSLLTQFTLKSYGTDKYGRFLAVELSEKSKNFVGQNVAEKIFFGTFVWFFHLVSDMAGSSSTVGKSGGTGIPGPLLSLAKELSVLPFFNNLRVADNSLSVFLSKLFNGTLLAKRDETGAIIRDSVLKFDLRGELGVAVEIGKQAVPVIANECIVRAFYFLRHLAMEMRARNVRSLSDMENIEWQMVRPTNNPTLARMLTISTGVFTTLDIGEAVISQKYWLSVNYIGVGRFAIAIGEDLNYGLKARNVQKIKQMYENVKQSTFLDSDNRIYESIGNDMNVNVDKFCLTLEQTEILYNLEYNKTMYDILNTKAPINNEGVKSLKKEWLKEWKTIMSKGFASFVQIEGAKLHWYSSHDELFKKIEENAPHNTWFRLVLLEAMLFEPYYPLSLEKDKKGNDVPSKKYNDLQNIINGYKKENGDKYLDSVFPGAYYKNGYIKRLRKCYDKVMWELNEVLKNTLTAVGVAAVIAVAAIATAGAFAPTIAVALVGSNFAGLGGAALTSACLAYLGGGAIAAGGAGMAGGLVAIVGGGAVLGLGAGAAVGGMVGTLGLVGKKNTIIQSAKLLVAVREIFLNDEHDISYSNSIYEQYVQNITDVEKSLVELRLKADVANEEERKKVQEEIKNTEKTIEAMKLARKSLFKFKSAFEEGLNKA